MRGKKWRRLIYSTMSSKVYKDNYLKHMVCLEVGNVKFITIDACRTRILVNKAAENEGLKALEIKAKYPWHTYEFYF